MSSTIQVRVDDDLKSQADYLFKSMGTDTTTAIRMFLTQAVACNGFPYEVKAVNPYAPMTEDQVMAKLVHARKSASEGKFQSAESVFEDLSKKYGL